MQAKTAPLYRSGLRAWVDERFPPTIMLLLFLMYIAQFAYGAAATDPRPVRWSIFDIIGLVAVWAFFLQLRIVDEHTDYDEDAHHHPGRVLQSGGVTLVQLRRVAACALLIQLATCALADKGLGMVTIAWCVAIAWTVLIGLGFCVRSWLASRPALETVAHTAVMPIAAVWMAQFGARERILPGHTAWLAGAVFLSALAFDLGRRADKGLRLDGGAGPICHATAAGIVCLLTLGSVAIALGLGGIPDIRSTLVYATLAFTMIPVLFALASRRSGAARYVRPTIAFAIVGQETTAAIAVLAARGLR